MIKQGKAIQKIKAKLEAVTAITDLVIDRIYFASLDQNKPFPAVMFQIVDVRPVEEKAAASDYENHRVQFNAYSSRADETVALLDHIRTAFDRLTDETGQAKIHNAFFSDRAPLLYDDDLSVYYASIDINVHFKN